MKIGSITISVLPVYVTCFFLFLYLPIMVLILFSFNASTMPYEWTGWTTAWYSQLLTSWQTWHALINSLIVASVSVVLSLTMAVLLVYYGSAMLSHVFVIFYGNLIIPEIVLAVGLLGFISLFSIPLGYITLIAGHTLLGLGYAVPVVHARYLELDRQLTEASLDLGATQAQTFFRIILPLLTPALIASGLLIFVISLDDFLIAFFCASAQTQTLPLYIFSVVRSGGSPMINALSTLLLAFGSIIILLMALLQTRKGISFGG